MFIEERKNKIVEYINNADKAKIEDVMSLLKISRTTARRDLIDLEKKNLILRTRGGLVKKQYFKYEFSLNEKKDLYIEKKNKIAKIAKEYINDGDVIYISGGTTTLELARILYDKKNLLVFTNAINIALELMNNSNINIKIVGGYFREKTYSMVGQDAMDYISKYNFDKIFLGVNGITNEILTTPNELESVVDAKAVEKSKEVYVLADETKFGSIAYSTICKIDDINYIITNTKPDSKFLEEVSKKGITVLYNNKY